MNGLVKNALILVAGLFLSAKMLTSFTPGGDSPAIPVVEPANGNAHPDGFGTDQMLLERDGSGQFHIAAQVNGIETDFLVDTGADIVSLTESDAEQLGLDFDPDAMRPIMKTASGMGYGTLVRIDTLEVGDAQFQDVQAVIMRGLSVNLLGQNVLRQLGKVELQGDRMVIEHQ